MEKRGQTTLFIILGIVIVAVLVSVFVFREDISKSVAERKEQTIVSQEPGISELQEAVDRCVEKTVKDAVYHVALQGGYFVIPDGYETMSGITVAYAYKNGRAMLPSLDKMGDEMALYTAIFMDSCMPSGFPGLELKTGIPKTSVEFNDDTTVFDLEYSVAAKAGETEYKLRKDYKVALPVRVKKVHQVAQDVVDMLKRKKEIDAESLVGKGVDIELQPLEDSNAMWTITDSGSELYGDPLHFVFITKS